MIVLFPRESISPRNIVVQRSHEQSRSYVKVLVAIHVCVFIIMEITRSLRLIKRTVPVEPTAAIGDHVSLPAQVEQPLTSSGTEKPGTEVVTASVISPGGKDAGNMPTKRVDHLAGFIAISAIIVTMNHFGLDFWAAVTDPTVDSNYPSEIAARNSIGSYFLDPLWIGPFLMISTRFLVSGYLRNGKLDNMAIKITTRTFRHLIPIAFIIMLEYSFMDLGAIT